MILKLNKKNNDTRRNKKAIEVMQHYVDGGEVEVTLKRMNNWMDAPLPSWDWPKCVYRIKEKQPIKPEVGKWYIANKLNFKCIAYEFDTYVFIYEDGTVFIKYKNDDFSNYKEVEP